MIQLVGDPEPELLADLDGARVGKTRMKELSERYFQATNQRVMNWAILAYPNEGWARPSSASPTSSGSGRPWRRDAARRAGSRGGLA